MRKRKLTAGHVVIVVVYCDGNALLLSDVVYTDFIL